MTMTTSSTKQRQTETAYDWFRRSQLRKSHATIPHGPMSAGWCFFRRPKTGIRFVDSTLQKRRQRSLLSSSNRKQSGKKTCLPVVEIRGSRGTGKTSTLITLASRFVVSTSPSNFKSKQKVNTSSSLPQVIILDNTHDVTAIRLASAVRSTILRQNYGKSENCTMEENESSSPPTMHEAFVQSELRSCLDRIHIVYGEDISTASAGWIPILESLRYKLYRLQTDCPTLLLWDGFLMEMSSTTEAIAGRVEVVRQLSRLLNECNVYLFATLSNFTRRGNASGGYDKIISHRIRLERSKSQMNNGHAFEAVLEDDDRVPFSLSTAGVLS